MKLIGLYKEHESISMVFCPTCFVFWKLNNKITAYKTVETIPVPGLSECFSCKDNTGLKEEQIERYLKEQR